MPQRDAGEIRLDYTLLDDEEIIGHILERRPEALEVLYDRYSGTAYSLALRILGDRGAAEEVVQDTFVAVWRHAGRYDASQGRLYSWIFRIARNRAIDELRRRKVVGRGGDRLDIGEEQQDPDEPHIEVVVAAELRSTVGDALGELPTDQREVVELAYMSGLSQREISERTGLPLGTIKTRTRLALKKLRRLLDATGGGRLT